MLLGQVGTILFWAAAVLGLISIVATIFAKKDEKLDKLAKWSFVACSVSFPVLFVILLSLFLGNQYQFWYVFANSKADYELQYKFSGVWSSQEGSILLWSVMSAIFGLLTFNKFGQYGRSYRLVYALFLVMLAVVSIIESPFKLNLDPAGHVFMAADGRGMAPSLLNYWMVIHPPTIFAGFGSLAVMFCLGIAALFSGDLESWIKMIRSWSLVTLSILGLGICMGGFWAYETLGWGGFWAWDPVENASFVPWCATAAFVHGIFVQVAKKKWQVTNAIFAGAPFILFAYGTFLTRSGLLGDTSVHSFAKMEDFAKMILVAMSIVSLLALAGAAVYYKVKHGQPAPEEAKPASIFNKSFFYGSAMWLLSAIGLVAALGMSQPLVQRLMGKAPKVIGEPEYHQVVSWFFIPTMIVIGIAPFLSWRGLNPKALSMKVLNPLAVAIGLTGCLLLWQKNGWGGVAYDNTLKAQLFFGAREVDRLPWVAFLTFLCLFAGALNAFKLAELFPTAKKTLGGVVTHIGVVATMLGLIVSHGLEQKAFFSVRPGKPGEAFGYQVNYVENTKPWNDRNNQVVLEVKNSNDKFNVTPGLYFQMNPEGPPNPMVWPGIHRGVLNDFYFVISPAVNTATEPVGLEKDRQARHENMILTHRELKMSGKLGTPDALFTGVADLTFLGEPEEAEIRMKFTQLGKASAPAKLSDGTTITVTKVDVDNMMAEFKLSTEAKPTLLRLGASIFTSNKRVSFKHMVPSGSTDSDAEISFQLLIEPVVETKRVEPSLTGSMEDKSVQVSDEYKLALDHIDVATKTTYYRFDHAQSSFPVEVFYKPLTWAVWIGVGIMTLGGFMAAWSRRMSRSTPNNRDSASSEGESSN